MLSVVLSLDQFPLCLLGCYGNARARTPVFDRIAAESIVFDQHFGEDFSPNAAGHAWWSGRRFFPKPEGDGPELPELLKGAGVTAVWLTDEGESSAVPLPGGAEVHLLGGFARVINKGTNQLSEWAGRADEARLLWMKLGRSVWEVGEEDSPLELVEKIDSAVSPLWDAIQTATKSQPVLFLFTAARGLPLRDPASMSAVPKEATEEFVHLPLIVHHSEHTEGGRSMSLTQTMDIPAILRNFFAAKPTESEQERDFPQKILGREFRERDAVTYGCQGVWEAIRTRDFHLVRVRDSKSPVAGKRFLFLKPEDIWDWHDVAAQEPEMTETLSEQLDAFLISPKTPLEAH